MHRFRPAYFRNFVFGVEDSLVSTVALLSGVASAGMARADIVLTGVVLICVEAFSMAIGSFLSERSSEEFATHKDGPERPMIIDALIMFGSYFVSGFIPIAPYIFVSLDYAVVVSMVVSLAALLALGGMSSYWSQMSVFRGGLRMVILGGTAIALGVAVGQFFS